MLRISIYKVILCMKVRLFYCICLSKGYPGMSCLNDFISDNYGLGFE
jgi:hypothetical protein